VFSLVDMAMIYDGYPAGVRQIRPVFRAILFGSAEGHCIALRSATQLFIADHPQCRPESLVVGNGALVDLTYLVEGAISELDTAVANRQPVIIGINRKWLRAYRSPPWPVRSVLE
jgi:hypothetical protein